MLHSQHAGRFGPIVIHWMAYGAMAWQAVLDRDATPAATHRWYEGLDDDEALRDSARSFIAALQPEVRVDPDDLDDYLDEPADAGSFATMLDLRHIYDYSEQTLRQTGQPLVP